MAGSNNNYAGESQVLPSRMNRAIEDILAGFELKAARVAGGKAPADELEQEFQAILETVNSETPHQIETVRKNMASPLREYKINPRYRAYAAIDANQADAVDKVDLVAIHKKDVTDVVDGWVHIPPTVHGLTPMQINEDLLLPQAAYTGLDIYVSQVKCLKETKLEPGNDEIWCGASFVDETGEVSSFGPFEVSASFNKGETKDYGHPGKLVQHFNIKEGGDKFPKLYTAFIHLVEKDLGKMSKWFKKLFDKVKDKVKQYLTKLGIKLGQKLGLGAASGLVGAAFGKVFDWIVGWIVKLFQHDPLGTARLQFTLNNYSGNWIGSGTSLLSGWSRYTGDGGDYRLLWRAKLVN